MYFFIRVNLKFAENP